ncbi:DNA mismatch repair protein MutS [Deinococcus peraridilitoris]|uniref:DNA mismatch repair protein MutS n=1 Tax=Deinococcus peraridilitoris (strain DSM 19664 / LMG 22246 / CIP 109416 / KR-200) TaxID=937777 RepID=L0A3Y2_DEIPD|nr:DNA mismatch repair protein MutS [Deinococcus peraridilitoris]AFZ68561.1 DNA mismatch repair protein MutS [Deinococcus peraridilitoris DSM 19664]
MPLNVPQSVLKGNGPGVLPPMLEQYVHLRDQHPDYLVLFQVGDFFETFGEDAERLSRLLGITLTHKTSKDFSTPMAGIPVRAKDQHIERLLAAGVRVAVAEQMELPLSGLVERRVTELLTPGTLTDERLLSAEENYLAAVASGDGYALALLDLSTGEFRCAAFGTRGALYDELARYRAREVLLAPEFEENAALMADFRQRFPLMVSRGSFEEDAAREELQHTLGSVPESLVTSALVRACGAALAYARATQQGRLEMVTRLIRYEPGASLHLPESAIRALELFEPNAHGGQTLIACLAHTRTAGGRRRLRAWLRSPLLDELSIRSRLDAVDALVQASDLRGGVRSVLYRAHDLERLAARVSSRRAMPKEVVSLARTLELLPELEVLLAGHDGVLGHLGARLSALPEVVMLIRAALVDNPPLRLGEGGLIREGFHAELDALRAEALAGREWMAELEARERARTGLPVKVGFNNVAGYYLEVTQAHAHKVPADYRQIATLKDRARFTRADVREREREIARCETAAERLEVEAFTELRDTLAQHTEALSEVAGALSELDVLSTLADIAFARGWSRPRTLGAGATELRLRQARHPVVELALSDSFVPNDADLDTTRRVLLLTGPNMAGKSTYLRTVALCALLHQIGSFVPADAAELPLFDGIHTRIGASDDLAGGRSTFMVEMSELAAILHGATSRSLVILDEVGRGTSTLDGLAIAWATLEHLHRTGAFALFATHYFELTRLEGELPGVVNLHVAAQEEAGALTFYHQVVPGAAKSSYGVEVARLAGLPGAVTARAGQLLTGLAARDGGDSGVVQELAALDLARLTPLQALELLHAWQRRLAEGNMGENLSQDARAAS